MKGYNPYVLGIDVQPRGIAAGVLSISDGSYVTHGWVELTGDTPASLMNLAIKRTALLGKHYKPLLAVVEEPTAMRSPSSTALYGLFGCVLGQLYSHSSLCYGIVVPQWKKLSGLNEWARDTKNDSKGVIKKAAIPEGVQHLLHEHDIDPPVADVYDALGVALAGYNINKELMEELNG